VSAISKALVGRRLLRKWEGFGWMVGTITSVNEDARRSMGGEKVNFVVTYDGEEEDGPVPHVLMIPDYQTTDDADYDPWLLLKAAPVPVSEATEVMEE